MIRAFRPTSTLPRRWGRLAPILAALTVAGCSPEGAGTVKLPPPAPATGSTTPAQATVIKPGRRIGVYQGPDGRKG